MSKAFCAEGWRVSSIQSGAIILAGYRMAVGTSRRTFLIIVVLVAVVREQELRGTRPTIVTKILTEAVRHMLA